MIDPDSIVCGAGMVINGKRYLVTSITVVEGDLWQADVNIKLMSWMNIDPALYHAKPPKPKNRRTKSKKTK